MYLPAFVCLPGACVPCVLAAAWGVQIIASRVRKGEYHTLGAFEADVMLLFDNAREYNVEGSLVYQVRFAIQAQVERSERS